MSGPPPKRAAQRRRRNVPDRPTVAAQAGSELVWPDPDPAWHHLAHDWYMALRLSGQAQFYERGDVETARIAADLLSVQLSSSRPSAVMIQAWWSMSSSLLVTEGDRRRARIELERAGGEVSEPDVSWIDDARHRLRGTS